MTSPNLFDVDTTQAPAETDDFAKYATIACDRDTLLAVLLVCDVKNPLRPHTGVLAAEMADNRAVLVATDGVALHAHRCTVFGSTRDWADCPPPALHEILCLDAANLLATLKAVPAKAKVTGLKLAFNYSRKGEDCHPSSADSMSVSVTVEVIGATGEKFQIPAEIRADVRFPALWRRVMPAQSDMLATISETPTGISASRLITAAKAVELIVKSATGKRPNANTGGVQLYPFKGGTTWAYASPMRKEFIGVVMGVDKMGKITVHDDLSA